MIKTFLKLSASMLLLLSLTGCGITPQNVSLQKGFWNTPHQSVVVARAVPPEPRFFEDNPNAGILEYGAVQLIQHEFRDYLHHIDMSWYPNLQRRFVSRINANHVHADLYNQPIADRKLGIFMKNRREYAAVDYRPLKGHVGGDKLLIIKVDNIGAVRKYASVIPVGSPKAVVALSGRLIDLNTNRILWRRFAQSTIEVPGYWKQPKTYPNFNKAMQIAIKSSEEQLYYGFFND